MGGGASVDLGPLHLGGGRIEFKPQLKVGYRDEHIEVGGGLGDVTEGFNLGLGASVSQKVNSEGQTMDDFFKNMRAEGGAKEVVQEVIDLIVGARELQQKILTKALSILGENGKNKSPAYLILMFLTTRDPSYLAALFPKDQLYFWGNAKINTGVGVSVAVKTGQPDPQDFLMFGVAGEAKIVASLSADVFVGIHPRTGCVKICMGFANCSFQMIVGNCCHTRSHPKEKA